MSEVTNEPCQFNLLRIDMGAKVDDVGQSAGMSFTGEPQDDADRYGFIGVLELRGDGNVPHLVSDTDLKGWLGPDWSHSPYVFMVEMDAGSWVKCNGRFRISIKPNPNYDADTGRIRGGE